MMTVVDGGAPTVVGQQSPGAYRLGEESAKGVKGLAITQIVMGTLCILFEIILVALYHSDLGLDNTVNGYIAPGIWHGLFILIIGVVGVATASQNTRGWIIAYMVVNIVAAVEMPTFITMAGIATGESTNCGSFWNWDRCSTYAPLALNILNLIMAISQFIITIVAASICCGPACCSTSGRVHATQMVIHGQQQQQQAMTTMVVGNQTYTFGQSQSGNSPPQTFGQQPVGVGYGYGVVQPPAYQQQQQQPVNYFGQQPSNSGPPQPQPQPHQQPNQQPAHPQKY